MQFILGADKKRTVTPNTPCGFILVLTVRFPDSAFLDRNIFNHMKNFFLKMLTPNSGVSSKRFIGIFTLFNLIGIAWLTLIKPEVKIEEYIFNGLLAIVIGTIGSTLLEKPKKEEDTNE